MSFLSSITGATLLSTGLNLFGQNQAKKNQQKEMKFNAEQAQLNRDFQREERLQTQEYNSASNQVKRMLDAGINPNAAFSSGYSSAETQPMSGAQASYSSSLSSSLLASASQQALNIAQIENIQSQTDSNKYALSWNKLTESQRYDMLVNMNEEKMTSIRKMLSDIGVNDFNKDLQERTFSWFAKRSEAEIKVINEQLNNLRIQYQDVLAGIELFVYYFYLCLRPFCKP